MTNENPNGSLNIRKLNWGGGLATRTAKNSIKTVFLNFKEYSAFFAALFLIQSMFWMLCFLVGTNIHNEEQRITEIYNYHILVENLTKGEAATIENKLFINAPQYDSEIKSYDVLAPDQYNDYYSIRVKLKNGGSLESFKAYYITHLDINEESVRVNTTPLYSYMTDYVGENLKNGILAAIFLCLMSILLLMTLYNIRINHYKFLYGIYMTCGAGFRKLFSTSLWEMFVISASTLPVSFLLTYFISLAIYTPAGSGVYIMPWLIPAFAILNFLIVYFAVRAPMKHMANKPPIELIVAQDNSNLVSSPRRSFRIYNKSFPYHYELYSTWRFRRYFARTLTASVIFTSIFICGVYISRINAGRAVSREPDAYVEIELDDITLEGTELEDAYDFADSLIEKFIEPLEGVSYALWDNRVEASAIDSHIFISRDTMKGVSEYALHRKNSASAVGGYEYATNTFDYVACDKKYIDTLCKLYEIDGDPYAILEDSTKIIISESIYGERQFYFKPGDKIYAATFEYAKGRLSGQLYTSHIDYLRELLDKRVYSYSAYEVAAVIRGNTDSDFIMVGMNYREYYEFTGAEINNGIGVWLDNDLRAEEANSVINKIKADLKVWFSDMPSGYFVSNNYTSLRNELLRTRRSDVSTLAISILLLLLSPVVWFFSQMPFYQKREKEVSLLGMFGAREESLRRVYSFAGLIMTVLSCLATLLLSLVSSFFVYKLLNSILPSYGFIESVKSEFYISGAALLVSLVVSMVCGYLSSYIPYRIGRHHREREYARQLSED